MAEVKSPRKGSEAFHPRKRARRIYPHLHTYPSSEKPKILDFAGYKAAMTHAILIDNRKGSPTSGQEISIPVTIVECPPIKVVGIRSYADSVKGLKSSSETWAKEMPKEVARKVKMRQKDPDQKLSSIESNIENISKIRLIVSTQPVQSGVGKKKPEIFEVEVGGKDSKEKLEFAKSLLAKEIRVADVLKEGEYIDIVAVTKGKGYAGPVERFGIKIQNRHAKKKLRHVGTLGQQAPGKVRHTVAQAGQHGFQRRTEFNKRIIRIGEKGEEITPKSGLTRYGVIRNNYILIEGSVPGSKKRLVRMRMAIRPGRSKILVPEIKEIVI